MVTFPRDSHIQMYRCMYVHVVMDNKVHRYILHVPGGYVPEKDTTARGKKERERRSRSVYTCIDIINIYTHVHVYNDVHV